MTKMFAAQYWFSVSDRSCTMTVTKEAIPLNGTLR